MIFIVPLLAISIWAALAKLIEWKKKSWESYLAERMVEREKLASTLLSSISHDLRTPLTSIEGAASTLLTQEEKLSIADRHRLLDMISEEAHRLNRLVSNILQITKIEAGHMNAHRELHSLEEIIGSALNRLEPLIRDRLIKTEISDLPLVPFDDLLIEQVLINILENALRYTPIRSPIVIRATRQDNHVCIEIMDRGLGVPVQDRTRIFEKFYRSGKQDTEGTGLGLAICAGIIKAHQGQIGVKEREGGGSIFYFSLPL